MISTVEALESITEPENIKVFENSLVLTGDELKARTEILLEAYSMAINIEGKTMLNMAKRQILPAANTYAGELAGTVKAVSDAGVTCDAQTEMLTKACKLITDLNTGIKALEVAVDKASAVDEADKQAEAYRDLVIPAMGAVRNPADKLETIIDAEIWPLPTYAEMLFLK